MTKKIKIVNFINDREGREEAERRLSALVNQGWVIASSGGGNAADLMWCFVVLQHNDADNIPAEIMD
jgi:Na+-transporting NADH:ubiquinone oxidoreductase subunit NqrF